jgi:hypothetical protein
MRELDSLIVDDEYARRLAKAIRHSLLRDKKATPIVLQDSPAIKRQLQPGYTCQNISWWERFKIRWFE